MFLSPHLRNTTSFKVQDPENWGLTLIPFVQSSEHLVKTMVFPVVIYGYQSWTIKKRKLSAEELMLLNCGAGEDS